VIAITESRIKLRFIEEELYKRKKKESIIPPFQSGYSEATSDVFRSERIISPDDAVNSKLVVFHPIVLGKVLSRIRVFVIFFQFEDL